MNTNQNIKDMQKRNSNKVMFHKIHGKNLSLIHCQKKGYKQYFLTYPFKLLVAIESANLA